MIGSSRNSPDWQTFRGFVRDRDTGRDGDLGVILRAIALEGSSRIRVTFDPDATRP